MSRPSPFDQLPSSMLLSCGALSAGGLSMLVAGVLAVTQPTLLPMLAKPTIAWPLMLVGGMLESGAMTILFGALRAQRRDKHSR